MASAPSRRGWAWITTDSSGGRRRPRRHDDLALGPMPFRDSHRYGRVYKSVSGVLSVVYPCTFLSSTPLSWGCETILSSRWLPLGLCLQSWSHVRSFTPCWCCSGEHV